MLDYKVGETALIASELGKVAAFVEGGSLFVFRSDEVEGIQNSDTLIELQGVTELTDLDFIL
ncbi:MAG: hypothetical protein RBR43_06000 [Desulfuromonadaceae bacterium]|nr:hypothetical protein [Desulfuromonas sp.]MDY0185414.1 hypothetical protein [Desulfuromonadaceae bacterium]